MKISEKTFEKGRILFALILGFIVLGLITPSVSGMETGLYGIIFGIGAIALIVRALWIHRSFQVVFCKI